jgi:hypothetical protein
LDQLESGTEADKAAIATLSKRGIDAKVREHLRGLVRVAQAGAPMELPVESMASDTQKKALEGLYAWHRDWSETARAVIRRRDHLILMGLGKRHSHKDEEDAPAAPFGVVPVTTPVTVGVPAAPSAASVALGVPAAPSAPSAPSVARAS